MASARRHDISYISPVPVEPRIVDESVSASDVRAILEILNRAQGEAVLPAEHLGLFLGVRYGLSESLLAAEGFVTFETLNRAVSEFLADAESHAISGIVYGILAEALRVSGSSFYGSADLRLHSEGFLASEDAMIQFDLIRIILSEAFTASDIRAFLSLLHHAVPEGIRADDSVPFLSVMFTDLAESLGVAAERVISIDRLLVMIGEAVGVRDMLGLTAQENKIALSEDMLLFDGILPDIDAFVLPDAQTTVYLNRIASKIYSEGAS